MFNFCWNENTLVLQNISNTIEGDPNELLVNLVDLNYEMFFRAYDRDEELVPRLDSRPDEVFMYWGLEREYAPYSPQLSSRNQTWCI